MSAVRGRWTARQPCPVCGGHGQLPQGEGRRCYGFASDDGRTAWCTREERAGAAPFSAGANAYRHRLAGACPCGALHGGGAAAAPGRHFPPSGTHRPPPPADDGVERDPIVLNALYARLLALLPLRPEHVAFYARRGDADLAAAQQHGYGSLPRGYGEARRVVEILIAEMGADVLRRIPGFYPRKTGDHLTMHTASGDDDAAIIPARNEAGLIVGLVRHTVSGGKPKYQQFHRSGEFYTFAGTPWEPDAERRPLAIVEGIHKAHAAAVHAERRGIPFTILGLPGAHLGDAAAAAITRLNPTEVIEALDADKFVNASVRRQREAMHKRLIAAGFEAATAVWEIEDGKGIDDLLVGGHLPRIRTIARRPEVTARRPEPIPDPAPVPVGRPLAEVEVESARRIDEFIGHPLKNQGRVLVNAAPMGVGKTRAAAEAVRRRNVVARFATSTKDKAAELAATFPWVRLVEGRNADNCANFPVVEAARKARHDVATLVCASCPLLKECRAGGYYAQFEQSGSLVGTAEMLRSGAFLRHGQVVIADDADLARVLVDTRFANAADLLHLAAAIGAGPLRELLKLLQWATDLVRADATPEGENKARFAEPLIGAWAWDVLARAAGGAHRLHALIAACPDTTDLLPAPQEGQSLTPEDIDAAPPALLPTLLALLREELPDFLAGVEFNSGVALHPGGLELRRVLPPLVDRETGEPILKSKAVLALDATPLLPLYERLAAGLPLEVYAPRVTLPANVIVTQLADAFYGKATVGRVAKGEDGATYRPGRARLLASLAAARADFPGDREAVLCSKALKDEVVAAGVPEERVLTYYGSRGLNTVEDADVLHALGVAQAPTRAALLLAHALHKGEAPITPHLTMRQEVYAGYRAPDGQGRAITVLDFNDPRVSAVHRQYREAELEQCVHRARLYRVGDAQADLFEPAEQGIARTAGERRRVRVVLHTAQPLPGLRVDELVYDVAAAPTLNDRRAADAEARILAARDQLVAEGLPVTTLAVVRLAGAHQQTVRRVLAAHANNLIRPDHTVTSSRFSNGLIGADQIILPSPQELLAAAADERRRIVQMWTALGSPPVPIGADRGALAPPTVHDLAAFLADPDPDLAPAQAVARDWVRLRGKQAAVSAKGGRP